MGGPELPDRFDSTVVADWMEINALIAPDRDFSAEGLKSAIGASGVECEVVRQRPESYRARRRSGSTPARMGERMRRRGTRRHTSSSHPADGALSNQEDEVEGLIVDVMKELRAREDATETQYPFSVDRSSIAWTGPEHRHTPYVFCLLLSYFSMVYRHHDREAAKLFEYVAVDAARNYLSGEWGEAEAIRFGFPREAPVPRPFGEALKETFVQVGDGRPREEQPPADQKDGGVDIIAWKHLRQRAVTTVLLLGNCATGGDLEELRSHKCSELHGDTFLTEWFEERPASPHLQAFFFPHAIDLTRHNCYKWRHAARNSRSLMFDRCQVAYWAGADANARDEHQDWIDQQLAKWRS